MLSAIRRGVRFTQDSTANAGDDNFRSMKTYSAVIEWCPDTKLYAGHVPGFPGAHSQGESLDELNRNLRAVIEMLLEDGEPAMETRFVGIQNVDVA